MQDASSLKAVIQEWTQVFMRHSMCDSFLFTKEKNLSMSQMGALLNIHRQRVCSVSDISDELGITSAAVSQMLERLVQQGLVERTEDPNDRRAKQIILTDKGRQVIQESFRAHHAWFTELADSFTPVEQEQISAALRLLIERASRLDETEIRDSQKE